MVNIKTIEHSEEPQDETTNPVQDAVVESLKELLGSTVFEKKTYLVPDSEEDFALDVFYVDDDVNPIRLSSFGVGSLPTKGTIKIDNSEPLSFRSEFYALGKTNNDVHVIGEAMSRLAFIISKNEVMFGPGLVVSGIMPETSPLQNVLLAPTPLGILKDVTVGPVVNSEEGFAIFWVNLIPVSEYEAEVFKSGKEGQRRLAEFLEEQGTNAYWLKRNTLPEV